jgi:hypothetical protein
LILPDYGFGSQQIVRLETEAVEEGKIRAQTSVTGDGSHSENLKRSTTAANKEEFEEQVFGVLIRFFSPPVFSPRTLFLF